MFKNYKVENWIALGFFSLVILFALIGTFNKRSEETPKSEPATTEDSTKMETPEAPKVEPCAKPKAKAIGYIVTSVVNGGFPYVGANVDAISYTDPPVHLESVRIWVKHSDATRGDRYFGHLYSCDAGATWKPGELTRESGPRMNEQKIQMLERTVR